MAYILSFFLQFELSHFFGHFSEWIEGTLYAQLLLQFNTDTFETLQTYCDHALKICMWLGYTPQINYTPGIYADGYIVFAFPFVHTYVRSFVRFFVHNSGTFVEFMSKFWLKFL